MLSSDAVDERRWRRRYLKQFVFPLNFFQCNQHFKSLKGLATKASKDRVLPSMYAIRGGIARRRAHCRQSAADGGRRGSHKGAEGWAQKEGAHRKPCEASLRGIASIASRLAPMSSSREVVFCGVT